MNVFFYSNRLIFSVETTTNFFMILYFLFIILYHFDKPCRVKRIIIHIYVFACDENTYYNEKN